MSTVIARHEAISSFGRLKELMNNELHLILDTTLANFKPQTNKLNYV